ncbi:MAG: MFS transporter [Bacteroidetes bacterium]|nr:MFS transporter [Bacteroidota bacterium]
MSISFYKALNIEKNEAKSVSLLITQSVFLGIFYGSFEVVANTLFLKTFDSSLIPNAYLISGIIGIIMTSIFSEFQKKINFSKLTLLNLFTISAITVLLFFGFDFVSTKLVVFVIFLMLGPLNIVALLGFWGTVSRIFTLRQGKRIYGIIDMGQIIGVIAISYSIPIILNYLHGTKSILLISAISIIIAFFFQFIIQGFFNLNVAQEEEKELEEKGEKKSVGFFKLLKDKYILLMSLFVIFSMIVAFFVQYSFLVVTNFKYPEEADLAKYLGVFTGTMMIFSIIIKLFVYSKLMKTYGLKVCLLILPVLMLLLTILASVSGYYFGFMAASGGFILFFLLISLSKLFSKSIKDSIEFPAFKLLYQSLDKNIRFNVQSRVDGTVNEFSALFSGLLLSALGLLSFFKIIHFSYTLIIILVIWIFVAFQLYKQYRKSLEKSLTISKTDDTVEENEEKTVLDKIIEKINNADNNELENITESVNIINPILYETMLTNLLEHQSEELKVFSINKIREKNILSAYDRLKKYIKKEKNIKIKDLLIDLEQRFSNLLKKYSSLDSLSTLIKSNKTINKVLAAKIIAVSYKEEYRPLLILLLKNNEISVKSEAIKTCGIVKDEELIPLLVDLFPLPDYHRYVYASVYNYGGVSVDYLEQIFNKSNIENNILIDLIKLYGYFGGEKIKVLLLNKLDNTNNEILRQTVNSLNLCNFQADEHSEHKINNIIELNIRIIAWNLAAITSLKDNNDTNELKNALQEELKNNYKTLFNLLSLAYDAKSVLHVKENLESGTNEGIGFALELLDLFVADELKPTLFPVLDDITNIEKIKKLQNFFPVNILTTEELLTAIINRDPNYIHRWTKACAIKNFFKFENFKLSDDLIAQLFNSDMLLCETSAQLIYSKDKDAYNNCISRVDVNIKKRLKEIIEYDNNGEFVMLYDKILSLKQMKQFDDFSSELLSKVVENISEKHLKKGATINIAPNDLNIIVKGKIVLNNTQQEFIDNTIIWNNYSIDKENEYTVKEDSLLFQIESNKIKELIFNNNEIITSFLNL